MLIACFNIRMKIILNVKVSCTVGVGTDQDPAERNKTEHKRVRSRALTLMEYEVKFIVKENNKMKKSLKWIIYNAVIKLFIYKHYIDI